MGNGRIRRSRGEEEWRRSENGEISERKRRRRENGGCEISSSASVRALFPPGAFFSPAASHGLVVILGEIYDGPVSRISLDGLHYFVFLAAQSSARARGETRTSSPGISYYLYNRDVRDVQASVSRLSLGSAREIISFASLPTEADVGCQPGKAGQEKLTT